MLDPARRAPKRDSAPQTAAMKLPALAPKTWRRFHGTMTVVWTALVIPTVLWWHDSIAWVALMSAYANMVGHFSAYQGSRAEASNDKD